MKNKLLWLCAIILIAGCTTVEPALSVSGAASLESYPVKGRQGLLINQKLSFGEYKTSKVRRSWTKGGNSRIGIPAGGISNYPDLISLQYVDRNQTFFFQMNDVHGNVSDVYASSEFASRDLYVEEKALIFGKAMEENFGINFSSENLFYLQLFLNDQQEPWQLILDNRAAQENAESYRGIFALSQDKFYTLKPITQVQAKKGPKNILMGSFGYEMVNTQGQTVAAVSLIDNGNVYFNTKDPEERFVLANLSAALLLQQNVAEQ